jgi:hypothetical protein
VLWVVPDNKRAVQLRAGLTSARTFDRELFQVTTPDELIDHVTGGAA